jgi:hypothetical protein
MIDPEGTWIDKFSKLPPANSGIEGITNLANIIEELTNKVEPDVPGATVSPGMFKWNKGAFIARAMALVPTMGPEWANTLAEAWQLGCMGAIITPGTVSNPSVWTASTVDVNTVPVAATTVPTIAVGQALVLAGLMTIPAMMQGDPKKSTEVMAKAFRAGVMAFTFVLIGLVLASPIPLPLTVPAH